MTVKPFIFPISPDPFPVLLDFIGGHVDKRTDTVRTADAFKHIDRPHDIGLIGTARILIALAPEGLGRQTVDGLAMLIGQAVPSFEAFYGQAPPASVDVRALAIKALGL